jgi:hypothetical protein
VPDGLSALLVAQEDAECITVGHPGGSVGMLGSWYPHSGVAEAAETAAAPIDRSGVEGEKLASMLAKPGQVSF